MIGAIPMWVLSVPPLLFVAGVGACVGSFLNVVAHRLPRGEGLWSPGSRCPTCETPLTWRENFPVFGWLALRGRCRFCRSPISAVYPQVEAGTGLLFGGVYAAWFLSGPGVAPAWAAAGPMVVAPFFVLVLALLAGLIAMSLVDARTFHIPVSIPWAIAAAALALHPLHAAFAGSPAAARPGRPDWVIPTIPADMPDVLSATLGAGAGLLVALGLLWSGALRRSFSDFERWHTEALATAGAAPPPAEDAGPTFPQMLVRTLLLTGPAVGLMAAGVVVGRPLGWAAEGLVAGMGVGLVLGVYLRRWAVSRESPAPSRPPSPPQGPPRRYVRRLMPWLIVLLAAGAGGMISVAHGVMAAGLGLLVVAIARTPPETEEGAHWLDYPFARREILREALFLAPVLLGAWAGWRFGVDLLGEWVTAPPIWLRAGAGALLGYLTGCGVVWAVRIGGTLAFGREAMGMGDVHLMGAVGAVAGWLTPVVGFLVAPAVALGGVAVAAVVRRVGREGPGSGLATAMPYGPSLALASAGALLAEPWVTGMIRLLVHTPATP